MSFSQDSKIAVRQALIQGLRPLAPQKGSGLLDVYTNVMKMAGADKEGELIGYLASEIYDIFINNGNDDIDPSDEYCYTRVFQYDGKRFHFAATSAVVFEDQDENAIDHTGLHLYVAIDGEWDDQLLGTFRKDGIERYEITRDDGGTILLRTPASAVAANKAVCVDAAKWMADIIRNHWMCPACNDIVTAARVPSSFAYGGLEAISRYCRSCAACRWSTPCTECGSTVGRRSYPCWGAKASNKTCVTCQDGYC